MEAAAPGAEGLTGGPDAEVEAMLAVLRATGAPLWEAMALVAGAMGAQGLLGWVPEAIPPPTSRPVAIKAALGILKAWGKACPDLAREGLRVWGQGRTVAGHLDLSYQKWIVTLPEGLTVRGRLSLTCCANLECLPETLVVGLPNRDGAGSPWDHLYVSGCRKLVGLPAGMAVGGDLVFNSTCALSALSNEAIRRMAPGIRGGIQRDDHS
jgi:hypothetical protein